MENFLDLFPKGRDKIRLTQEIILTDIKKELDKGTKFIMTVWTLCYEIWIL